MTHKLKRITAFVLVLAAIASSSIWGIGAVSDPDDPTAGDKSDVETDAPEQDVVYVKDTGSDSNDGKSEKNAFQSMNAAFTSLSEKGGIVVICGKLTLSDEASVLPSHQNNIEITSYHDGIDYRSKHDAEIYYKSSMSIHGPGKTSFYGIKLHSENTADIFCNGTNVCFGSKIDNVSDSGSYPRVWGGIELSSTDLENDGDFSDFTLQIDSGSWSHVTLGNYRKDTYAPFGLVKNANLIITGGNFLSKDGESRSSSLVSGAFISEHLSLQISGGVFYGSFYIIGDEGSVSPYMDLKYTADIKVSITDGVFMGEYIKALNNPDAELYGTYDFSITGGSFSSLTYISCEGVRSDISLTSFDQIQSKLHGFEKVVYVDPKNGNDRNGGEDPASAKATLSSAVTSLASGGTVVICSEYTLPEDFVMTYNHNPVKITSKYADVDYGQSNGASITISGSIYLQSDITFDNIKMLASSDTMISCQESLTISNTCATEGNISIRLLKNENIHSLNIHSGNFSVLELQDSDALTYLTITNGTVDEIRSSEEKMFTGDILLDISGGEIKNNIDLSSCEIGGNVQLILGKTTIGGDITVSSPSEGKVFEALITEQSLINKVHGFEIISDVYAFVKDGGTGDGSTPSLAAPDLSTAYSFLKGSDGSIIICGKYTHSQTEAGVDVGTLTYSGKYRSIDFSSVNNSILTLQSDFNFLNNATIKDITIKAAVRQVSFRCNSHIVLFDWGINVISDSLSGDSLPSIHGAESSPEMPFNAKGESVSDKIIINSGKWNNVYASAAATINGSVIMGALYGTEDLSTNCSITVSGGIIYGGVYASGSMKSNCTSDVTISFSGGEIHGYVSPSYYSSAGYKGKYKINITGGDFSAVAAFIGPDHVGADKFYANVDVKYDQKAGMDSVSTYFNPISSGLSTLTYYDGYWYHFSALDNTITVRRSISVMGVNSHEPYETIEVSGEILDMSISLTNNRIYVLILTIVDNVHITKVFSSKNTSQVSFDHVADIEDNDIMTPELYISNGQTYLFYSKENENKGFDICCVKLKENMQFGTDPIKIISATEKWENNTLSTPRLFTAEDGSMYLAYTGGDIYRGGSMLGIVNITDNSDLLNSANYKKQKDPVFYENETHSDLILSSIIMIDSSEPYLVFNSCINNEKMLVMQSFSYDTEGIPYFSDPCDIQMQYVAFNIVRELEPLFEGFEFNIKENVDTISTICPPFSFKFLKMEHFIIIACGLGCMLLVLAIVLIRKFITNQSGTRTQKRSALGKGKLNKIHSRRRSGKLYAAYLEQSASNETITETNETPLSETISDPSPSESIENTFIPSSEEDDLDDHSLVEYATKSDFDPSESTAELDAVKDSNNDEIEHQ